MAFELMPLPYDSEALAPAISAETLIFTRAGGDWRIVRAHASAAAPVSPGRSLISCALIAPLPAGR